MPNTILCKHCHKQCTDHIENPQNFKVVNHKKPPKDLTGVVCDKYTPDIKKGQLACICYKQSRTRKWCNGRCLFKRQSIEND